MAHTRSDRHARKPYRSTPAQIPRQLDYGSGKRSIAAARRRLGDDGFTEASSQGQSMTLDQALAFGLEEPGG
ncbi:MAG: hypothetical protein P8Y14_22980 [Anaerolineales bacterium]